MRSITGLARENNALGGGQIDEETNREIAFFQLISHYALHSRLCQET